VLIGHVDERAYADLRACASPLPRAPLPRRCLRRRLSGELRGSTLCS
jgi:hypothetical protein